MAVCSSPVKLLGQTLFLGASVSSFNANMGWGGSDTRITVDLVEDNQPSACYMAGYPLPSYPTNLQYADDHYYTCGAPNNDSCYVNERGEAYDSNALPAHATKNVPGKLHYLWSGNKYVSRYWVHEDPGFFAIATRVAPDGTLNDKRVYTYNIIGIPVIFKLGDFTFSGIIESWERQNRLGVTSYSVSILSPEVLLNESYVILDKYPGSIFAKDVSKSYGSPRNYVGPALKYSGQIAQGVIPNVFNVYGFLESMGYNNFGGADKSDKGIPSAYALNALSVLTCCKDTNLLHTNDKTAFSPFGKIISRTMETVDSARITPAFNTFAFGVVPPTSDAGLIVSDKSATTQTARCAFALDLSDIKRPPLEHRIEINRGGIMTVSEFITYMVDAGGQDRQTRGLSFSDGNKVYNIIKINTIDRSIASNSLTVAKTVSSLERSGLGVSSTSFGQEHNKDCRSRVMRIGGPQQRLLQAKNYRLAYTQTNYIYNASINKFVNLNRFAGIYGSGKIRIPSYFSTRNKGLSVDVLGADIDSLFNDEETSLREKIYNNKFYTLDTIWKDSEVSTDPEDIRMGNYPYVYGVPYSTICTGNLKLKVAAQSPSKSTTGAMSPGTPPTSTPGAGVTPAPAAPPASANPANPPSFIQCIPDVRLNPLWFDTISPFFGHHNENVIEVNTSSNKIRVVRPVYQDSWDGQLVVGFYINEIPLLGLGFTQLPDYTTLSTPITSVDYGPGVGGGAPPPVVVTPTPPVSSTPTPSSTPTAYLPAEYMPHTGIGFVIRETEFRCAMLSPDAYISYCFGKSKETKPDLYRILIGHYMSKGLFFAPTPAGGLPGGLGTGLGGGSAPPITIPSGPPIKGVMTKSAHVNFDFYINHNFIKDLITISNFIKGIADQYYGKKYLVKLTGMSGYKDERYTGKNIQVGNTFLPVFQGNRKLTTNYVPTSFAWEEPGNYIDDKIIVGDENYYILCKEDGTIPPIVGYNSTKNIDYLKLEFCKKLLEKRGDLFAESKKMKSNIALQALAFIVSLATIVGIVPRATAAALHAAMLVTDQKKLTEINKKIKELNKTIGGYLGCDETLVKSLDPATLRKNALNVIKAPGFLTDSLNLSSLTAKEDFALIQTTDRSDAFGQFISPGSKLYCPTNVSENIVYLNPIKYGEPRAIIDGKGITLENSSYMYAHDPNLTVISNIALEDLIYHDHTFRKSGATMPANMKRYLDWLATFTTIPFGTDPKVTTGQIAYQAGPANASYLFQTLAPKMAHPLFAAVPLKSNQYCYGPWTNFPSVRPDLIFRNSADSKKAIENMVSKCDIEYDDDLVPWKYGGMPFLDAKVVSELAYKENFQYTSENGKVTIQGAPIFNLGGRFEPLIPNNASLPSNSLRYGNEIYQYSERSLDYVNEPNWTYDIDGLIVPRTLNLKYPISQITSQRINNIELPPIIQSITMSVGGDGLSTTTYSFGSYDKKRGTYGKQHADAIRDRKLDSIKDSKLKREDISVVARTLLLDTQKLLQAMKDVGPAGGDYAAKYQPKLYGSSPVETLIGRVTAYAPFPMYSQKRLDIGDDGEALTPSGLHKAGRTNTWVGLYMGDEVGAELVNSYESKSAMSLDGLLSPISFYPTQYAGTYPISSHITGVPIGPVVCPRCGGDGKIAMTFVDYKQLETSTDTLVEYPCPACARSKLVVKNAKIIDSMKNKTAAQQIAIALKDTKPEINIYAYNPIVVPYGEFRNPNAQTVPGAFGLDKCRHSISIVGRGEMPIGGLHSFGINENLYGGKLVGLDGKIGSAGVSSDYYEHDIFNEVGVGVKSLQNQRFFGLRGPLMLHSWGYDTAGYPVPNLNDEPKDMDQYGRFRRFILNSEGLNDYKKEGVYINKEGQLLGDIVGRNYEWDPAAVKYKKIKAKPSKYFHLNWAERPELWPVGPIDLRWDDSRKVWAAGGGGCTEELLPPSIITNSTDISTLNEFLSSKESNTCPYKMVNITLEEDLIKEDDSDETYATRGFIDDIEYSKEPLTRGYRRLVYVVDKAGYSAPRGTKLLCKYSIDSGFYEPISKPVTMAKGKIVNSTNVKIEQHYIQGRRAGIVPSFVVPFDNPMEFETTSGKNGMFVYINGKWTLTSIKN